jgi:1-acyl-sn-glycerol-3-phosphate acyltransferase
VAGLAFEAWAAGAALGAVTVAASHCRRLLGWTPIGWVTATGAFAAAAWAGPAPGVALALGLASAWTHLPVALFPDLPEDRRGRWFAVLHALALLAGLAAVWLAGGAAAADRPALLFGSLALASGLAAFLAWRWRLREGLELIAAALLWPLYRFRVVGPGVGKVPPRGPLLVIANHSAWPDPLWLGKVLPRTITPMMTSVFYDLPVLHWLMRRVVRTIRVQESRYRREAPELAEAVARLDAGECLVVFPEGWLRRKEDQLLRQFGQGIWRILRDRPDTPVMPCWIEGGWGSFLSHRGGPPGKGKPFDWFRRITIVFGEPISVPPEVLADGRQTRRYLMDLVLAQRGHLPV